MDDLLAFLAARLDEDEAVAQGAARTDDGRGGQWLPVHFGAGGFDSRVDDHIARHDPARVLREVEADRRLLAEWQEAEADPAVDDQWNAGLAAGLRLAVQIRTTRYGGHPDYRPGWKP
jgi:hypothetical protein